MPTKPAIAAGFLGIVLGPFGLFCFAWVFIFAERAQYLSAVVAMGAAGCLLGLAALFVLVATRKVSPRIDVENFGTTVRPDRRLDRLLVAASVAGFVAMVCYAVFAPLDMLDIRPPRGYGRFLVGTCAVGALVGVFSLRQIFRARGTSYLRMTVQGIETATTMTTQERSWDEVTDVVDRKPDTRQASGAIYILTADGRTRELPASWYTPGGHALGEVLRFYWQHPEAREELADDRVVHRLEAELQNPS
ncbi:hypothetical protein SAMN04489835_2231 [Mycolicibacterium rutilum]|uniref:PH domain-containing protein n=1 Tax=Mycolicibacterium rutilum TaxID=370526 RepID=A0A1H6JKR4_MYCRU|nr:hypothetical protein [Mycolicibacterium rutilum]SEH62989.1 hypothetical protein SAMN04489835_2231 [Mycolicibacterium rutilum]